MTGLIKGRAPVLVLAAIALAGLVAACGGSSGGSGGSAAKGGVQVDVGNGKRISLTKPLKIAYFTSAASNALGSSQKQEMAKLTKQYHLDVTTFDSPFDANMQLNQIQTAIHSHRFNVLAIWPVDGQTICKVASVDAPAAGLLVTDFDQPLCRRFLFEGTKLWQPGTLNYLSGYNTRATFRQWFEAIAKANPGPQNVGVLEGVITDGDSQDVADDMRIFKTEHPNFHFLSKLNTTYTAQTGYQQALAMIHAHPDINLIISDASAITQGAARAVQQLGKTDQIKIADYGGSKEVVPLLKSGLVQLSMPARPRTEAREMVAQLLRAADGKPVPRFTQIPAPIITKDSVDQYTPEY